MNGFFDILNVIARWLLEPLVMNSKDNRAGGLGLLDLVIGRIGWWDGGGSQTEMVVLQKWSNGGDGGPGTDKMVLVVGRRGRNVMSGSC